MTDEEVWYQLMWASLAVDFQPQGLTGLVLPGHNELATEGEKVWQAMADEADSRPSMTDWRQWNMETTNLEKAKHGYPRGYASPPPPLPVDGGRCDELHGAGTPTRELAQSTGDGSARREAVGSPCHATPANPPLASHRLLTESRETPVKQALRFFYAKLDRLLHSHTPNA